MIALPLLSLLALIPVQLLDREAGVGRAALRAAVIWGLLLAASTELLSLFRAVDRLGLAIFWAAALLATLAWLGLGLRRGRRLPDWRRMLPGSRAGKALLALVFLLAAGTLFVALRAPVQTYDSLSYHMARVAHWAQNRSVAVYPTGIERQNMMGPLAEYAVLHFYVLQGGDLFANLVDWLAYLGCVIASAFIAGRLGSGTDGRLLAGVFAASLPMAIAQASSTMVDLVLAFWVLCALAEIAAARAEGQASWRSWLYLAAASGLAVLTKSTAAAFLLPFLLWFGLWALRRQGLGRTAVRVLACAALVAAVNGPFWLRNTRVYGTPLGSPTLLRLHANQIVTPGVLASNVLRNLSLNFGTPSAEVNRLTSAVISKLHSLAGMQLEDPRTTFNGNFSITDQVMMEDRVGNPFHLLFIAIAAGTAVFSRRSSGLWRGYALVALSTFLVFSIGNTYQVFGNRLLVPFFLLTAPLLGLLPALWSRPAWLASGTFLLLAGLPWLLSLQSRPLLPIRGQTLPESLLGMTREDLYFANVGGLSSEQYRVAENIRLAGCREVGLMLGGDDPEYLWWLLLGAPDPQLRIEWLVKGTPSDRFADPAFAPCAVICTSCPADWESAEGLPLAYQGGDYRLFLETAP